MTARPGSTTYNLLNREDMSNLSSSLIDLGDGDHEDDMMKKPPQIKRKSPTFKKKK